MTALSNIPNLPPYSVDPGDLQVWWQLVKEAIDGVLADQQSQIDDINAILDPNNLTPDKKSSWIFQYAVLTGEQADLDAKAAAAGVSHTTYDGKITALNSYLATLTSPVAWNDESGDTTIVATTFRTKFSDVLTAKQALVNATTAAAQSTANTAQSTATTAQSTATTAQTTANTANTNATAASTAASAAQSTADTVNRNDSISTSWTSPGTILSASDAGSSATITISNHTRKYTDVSSKSVTGSSITGLNYSTGYYVYYDQTARTGGAVTYHATTDPNAALPGAAAGRHYCGFVTTPASGGGPTSGEVNPPAGGGGGGMVGTDIP